MRTVVALKPAGIAQSGSSIDPAQIDYLLTIGDQSFVDEMIESFFNDADESMASLNQSVANHDLNEFRFAAHAMKSCSNNIGAAIMAALCGKFENITEADFDTKAAQHQEAVQKAYENVRADLQPFASHAITPPVASSG